MSDIEPLTAPPGLMRRVEREAWLKGLPRHDSGETVTPFVNVNGHPNPWTPRGQPRWVARCPECPGAEVVSKTERFLCGSCGAEADVDWSEA